MNILRHCMAAFAVASLSVSASGVAAKEPLALSAYGQLPEVEETAISPGGKNLAVLLTESGVRQLMFLDSDMKVIRRIPVGDIKVRHLDWIGDDQLLLVSSQTQELIGFTTDKAEMMIAQVIPATGDGKPYVVFADKRDVMDRVFGNYGKRLVDNRWTLNFGALELQRVDGASNIPNYVFDHNRPYLYSVDAQTGRARRVATAAREGYDRSWRLDADGNVVVTMDISNTDGDWVIRGPSDTTIASGTEPNGRAGLLGLGYDGTTVLYSTRDADNVTQWYEVPLAGGNPQPFLQDVDVDRLYFDEASGRLIGYLDAAKGPVFRDRKMHQSAISIRKAFADYDMHLMDWTPDFKTVLVRTSGNKDSGSWYMINLTTGQASAFAYERMAIGPEQVGPISTFAYTAQDGLALDGILTLPPGKQASNLPVIVLPHGGPHTRDTASFDWWAQAFASRGYAVFQPNFRGSTNKDEAFVKAGYGEWGRKMQTDLSDGLAALAEKGVVDPSRACIVGASYGGYAALAGVTLQQDIYRCAVAVAPVSDLNAMYLEDFRASGRERLTKARLLERLGPKDGWDAVSPRRFAANADAPIMLIHGVDDTVVPYSHSHQMADKLKDAGKPYELVKLEGEDHWLSLSSTRLQMLEAAVGFVEKHNPAD